MLKTFLTSQTLLGLVYLGLKKYKPALKCLLISLKAFTHIHGETVRKINFN